MNLRLRKAIAAVLIIGAASAALAPLAGGATVYGGSPAPAASAGTATDQPSIQRQPAGETSQAGSGSGVRGSGTNWLGVNGMLSPLCKSTVIAKNSGNGDLTNACRRSGLASMPSPSSNLGIDVHVETGITKPGSWWASTIHNAIDTAWGIMVSITATLFAALEWAFSLNLLDTHSLGDFAVQLKNIENTWTTPLLRIVMALTGGWIAYHAIMLRRFRMVSSELGASLAMLICVMAITANPVGTVGAVNQASNDLALYAMSTVRAPADAIAERKVPEKTQGYSDGLRTMFNAVGTRSWALLEFGNVAWATNPKKFDRDLQKVAKDLAENWPKDVQQSVAAADTNAELFLAFPPNTAERDGINDTEDGKKTLFRALCNDDDVKKCKGKYKALADQRTEAGTGDRAGQFFLVATGLVLVWLLLGGIAVGLIGAAVATVFYIFMTCVTAPLAVFMWGDAPRKFRGYLWDLAGALFSKLIFGIALALVMVMFEVMISLQLPFVPQWILMFATFIFLLKKRKELMGLTPTLFTPGRVGRVAMNKARQGRRRASRKLKESARPKRRDGDLSDLTEKATRDSRRRRKEDRVAQQNAEREIAANARRPQARVVAQEPAKAMSELARKRAIGMGFEAEHVLGPLRERAGRLAQQEATTTKKLGELKPGSREHRKERRRQVSLRRRMSEARAGRDQAQRLIARGRDVAGRPINAAAETSRAQKIIGNQARLPAPRRDYRQLAGMANMTPEAYDQLSGRERNQVRSAINRELAAHRATSTTPTGATSTGIGEFVSQSTIPVGTRPARDASELARERVGGRTRTRPEPRPRATAGRS